MKKLILTIALFATVIYGAGYSGGGGGATEAQLAAKVDLDASNFADYPQTITVTNTGTASDTTFTYTGMVEDRPAYGIGGTNYIYYLPEDNWFFLNVDDSNDDWGNASTNYLPPKVWTEVSSNNDEPAPTLSYTLPAQDFVSAIGAQEYEANGTNFVMSLVYTNGLYQAQLIEQE